MIDIDTALTFEKRPAPFEVDGIVYDYEAWDEHFYAQGGFYLTCNPIFEAKADLEDGHGDVDGYCDCDFLNLRDTLNEFNAYTYKECPVEWNPDLYL